MKIYEHTHVAARGEFDGTLDAAEGARINGSISFVVSVLDEGTHALVGVTSEEVKVADGDANSVDAMVDHPLEVTVVDEVVPSGSRTWLLPRWDPCPRRHRARLPWDPWPSGRGKGPSLVRCSVIGEDSFAVCAVLPVSSGRPEDATWLVTETALPDFTSTPFEAGVAIFGRTVLQAITDPTRSLHMRQRRRLEFGPPLTATGTATTRRAEAAATLYDVHVANTISSDRKRAPMGTPPRSTPERAAGRGGKRRARMPGESGSRHMLSGQRAPPQWTARSRDARAWLGWTGVTMDRCSCGRGRQRIDQAQGLTGRRQSRQNRWTSEAGDGRPSRLGISHASDGTRRSGYVAGGGSRASPYRLAVGRGCEKRRKKRSRCRWSGVHFFFGRMAWKNAPGPRALAEDGRRSQGGEAGAKGN
ncbi:hypothetical protein L1887_58200 [Cichorium endivia]|nr:hypothetical protein L1887_58200 [Cichorium endivia]